MEKVEYMISYNHPARAGHLPGNPIVPGVLILEKVINCFFERFPEKLLMPTITDVKFHRTLEYGVVFAVAVELRDIGGFSFQCFCADEVIAKGSLSCEES